MPSFCDRDDIVEVVARSGQCGLGGNKVWHRLHSGLKEKLIKISAKVVSHGRYVAFQMAEVAIPRGLFADILRLIVELRAPPDPALA